MVEGTAQGVEAVTAEGFQIRQDAPGYQRVLEGGWAVENAASVTGMRTGAPRWLSDTAQLA